jgi:predicted anti-sigma-YlaC factor YlaD
MDPCEHCEEVLQQYLDRVLSEEERMVAEKHLEGCSWCRKRYRFEESLRRYVRQATAVEMAPELKLKLSSLRTPLL